MNSALVTGGAGFIGSGFVRALRAARPEVSVTVLDALTYAGSEENLRGVGGLHFVRGDVRDGERILDLMRRRRVDTVVHFAAESHVDRSLSGPGVFLETNVLGTAALLEAARRLWLDEGLMEARGGQVRFHQVSTDEVYGDRGDGPPATEDSPYRPGNPYAASKAAADHLVRAWGRSYGLPWSISLGANTYGPRQLPEKLLPLVITRALAGEELPLYGDGRQVREWLHVDDHAAAVLAILSGGPGRAWNIGSGQGRENLAMVREVCALLDRLAPDPGGPHARRIRRVRDRPGHDRRYAMDAGAARTALGWAPRIALADGLEATVRWYLEHPGWVARCRGRSSARAGEAHQRDPE